MKCALFAVLVLMSATTSAQSVHKCVATDGSISYQSEPCDGAATVKKTWDAVPEQLGNAEQSQRRNAQQKAAEDAEYLRRLAHGNSGVARRSAASMDAIPKQSSDCKRARKQRDAFYAQSPKRTSKDMERWNKHVYDTCK